MSSETAVVVRSGSRFAIARIGVRGGVRIVKMSPGILLVRRIKKAELDRYWTTTDYDPRTTAEKFMKHMAGVSNLAEKFLRATAYGDKDEGEDAEDAKN